MNPVIDILMKRKSMRAYEQKEIDAEIKAGILKATLRAPTLGRPYTCENSALISQLK